MSKYLIQSLCTTQKNYGRCYYTDCRRRIIKRYVFNFDELKYLIKNKLIDINILIHKLNKNK